MKRKSLIISLVLLLACAPNAFARVENENPEGEITRTTPASPDVVVTVCIESGDVAVRGWDRPEVRARVEEAEKLELQRGASSGDTNPAKRVEVLMSDSDDGGGFDAGDCAGNGSLELDVPRGATVVLKVRSGDVEVADVGEARIETLDGDVDVRNVAKGVEVSSISGTIFLKNSSGRVSVKSISGDVEVADARTLDAGEDFSAKSVSGDVNLDRVEHARVEAGSVSGDVLMTGPLARAGSYTFKSTSGDVTLTLPADSSFRVNARVVSGGDIITDFPIKQAAGANPPISATPANPASPAAPVTPVTPSNPVTPVAPVIPVTPVHHGRELGMRLVGSYGGGDAEINLSSFSGTIHLRKKEK